MLQFFGSGRIDTEVLVSTCNLHDFVLLIHKFESGSCQWVGLGGLKSTLMSSESRTTHDIFQCILSHYKFAVVMRYFFVVDDKRTFLPAQGI